MEKRRKGVPESRRNGSEAVPEPPDSVTRDVETRVPMHGNGSGPLWPADKVERRTLATLLPYPQNARTHSKDQVEQIAASMLEFGWTVPILVDEDDGIIAGHGRLLAADKLGWTEGPVMVARGWTDAQKRAYVLADNQLALNADWDRSLLKLELTELKALDFDLPMIGFDLKDLIRLGIEEAPPADASPQLNNLEYSVVIRCRDEEHQVELMTRLEQEGITCQALIS